MVGIVPKESSRDNWMEGLPCAIAWDTVQDYVIFASMDDYLTRLRAPQRRWPGPNKTVQRTVVSRLTRSKIRTSVLVEKSLRRSFNAICA